MFSYIISILLALVGLYVVKHFLDERRKKKEEAEAFAEARRRLEMAALRRSSSTLGKKQSGKDGPRIAIFFGSQTGTAEDFAQTLTDEACDLGFDAQHIDLEDYDVDDLSEEKAVILCVATYGEGEPTDNAKEFDEWLMSDERDSDLLENVKFAVFALGNHTYDNFCEMGRRFDKRFQELGATRLYPRGEGDDETSLEEDFDKWKRGLWKPFCDEFGVKMDEDSLHTYHRRSKMEVIGGVDDKSIVHHYQGGSFKASRSFDIKHPFVAKVIENRELHTDQSDRSCRHVEIDLSNSGFSYQAGDHLGVFPENDPALVEDLLARFPDVDGDAVVSFRSISDPKATVLPGPCTIRRLLTSFIDIASPPRRAVLAALAQHTDDEQQKKKLEHLADSFSDEGSALYQSYIQKEWRCINDVLDEFDSINGSIDLVIELLPKLQPRYYSISSSPKVVTNNAVHITAVLTQFKTGSGRTHNGVATTWLKERPLGAEVPVYVRTSEFRLPPDPSTPVIMVGPGTGFAPFRGFLQDLSVRRQKAKDVSSSNASSSSDASTKYGKTMLFFGCRSKNIDWIYQEEMEAYHKDGVLDVLEVAFSRDQEQKVYVQHKIAQQSAQIWDAISNGAYIYVCGDGKAMSKDVHKALVKVLVEHGKMEEKAADEFLIKMQKDRKYQLDVW